MNDEQCQALIDSLDRMGNILTENSDRIVSAIDDIYTTSNEGVEILLKKLIDAIDDAAARI